MNWCWVIFEHSMEQTQVAGIYFLPQEEIQHIADRLFEQGRILDYEVVYCDNIDGLNELLRNEILLPDEDD